MHTLLRREKCVSSKLLSLLSCFDTDFHKNGLMCSWRARVIRYTSQNCTCRAWRHQVKSNFQCFFLLISINPLVVYELFCSSVVFCSGIAIVSIEIVITLYIRCILDSSETQPAKCFPSFETIFSFETIYKVADSILYLFIRIFYTYL